MTSAGPEAIAPAARRLHVIQGSHEVTADPDVMLTTILGSCVAACIRDRASGVGGMNHFLLPEAPAGGVGDRRYGVQSMELLINALLRAGARRDRLEAKVFGGARMLDKTTDVGARNAEFVRRFLADEDIPLAGESLGGLCARRIQFWPGSGRVRQQMIQDADLVQRERATLRAAPAPAGQVELFS